MHQPLVSVLISAYNAGDYLRPSLESILSQTYSNLEILLLDDGSNDGSMETIKNISDNRVRIIRQQNTGKAAALNRLMDELKGDFYAIHDADDISYPRRIELQVQCMLENPEIAAVFTGYDLILNGQTIAPKFRFKGVEQCRRDIENFQMPSHDPTAMYRISMVRDFRYDPKLKVGEGLDYILRVGEAYPMMVLGQCLYSYRFRGGSLTKQNADERNQIVREVLKTACRRRKYKYSDRFCGAPNGSNLFSHRSKENNIIAHFMDSVVDLKVAGKIQEAFQTAIECSRLHPFDPYYYKPLIYSVVPLSLVTFYRSAKNQKLNPIQV